MKRMLVLFILTLVGNTLEDERTMDQIITDSTEGPAFQSEFGAPPAEEDPGSVVVEYDMRVNAQQLKEWNEAQRQDLFANMPGAHSRRKRKALRENKWQTRRFLIAIDQDAQFSPEQFAQVNEAARELRRKTCLDFVTPRLSELSQNNVLILLTNGKGCSSAVGRNPRNINGYQVQKINLAAGCRIRKVLVHEICHALGLFHEQSRPDRDNYVTVIWDNIRNDMRHNFRKFPRTVADTRQTTYDYRSLMHYGPKAFSKNQLPTLRTHNPSYQDSIGTFDQLSNQDALAINNMFHCQRHEIGRGAFIPDRSRSGRRRGPPRLRPPTVIPQPTTLIPRVINPPVVPQVLLTGGHTVFPGTHIPSDLLPFFTTRRAADNFWNVPHAQTVLFSQNEFPSFAEQITVAKK